MFTQTRALAQKYGPRLAVLSLGAAALSANAAIDVTAVTTGMTDAGVALLAVIAALTALSVSIFGVAKVYAFIKRKAGA